MADRDCGTGGRRFRIFYRDIDFNKVMESSAKEALQPRFLTPAAKLRLPKDLSQEVVPLFVKGLCTRAGDWGAEDGTLLVQLWGLVHYFCQESVGKEFMAQVGNEEVRSAIRGCHAGWGEKTWKVLAFLLQDEPSCWPILVYEGEGSGNRFWNKVVEFLKDKNPYGKLVIKDEQKSEAVGNAAEANTRSSNVVCLDNSDSDSSGHVEAARKKAKGGDVRSLAKGGSSSQNNANSNKDQVSKDDSNSTRKVRTRKAVPKPKPPALKRRKLVTKKSPAKRMQLSNAARKSAPATGGVLPPWSESSSSSDDETEETITPNDGNELENAINTVKSGTTIKLLQKDYTLLNPLVLKTPEVTIKGSGDGCRIIGKAEFTTVLDIYYSAERCRLMGFEIFSHCTGTENRAGLYLCSDGNKVEDLKLTRCGLFISSSENKAKSLEICGGDCSEITALMIVRQGRRAIPKGNKLYNLAIRDFGFGVYVNNGISNNVKGLTTENVPYAVTLYNADTNVVKNLTYKWNQELPPFRDEESRPGAVQILGGAKNKVEEVSCEMEVMSMDGDFQHYWAKVAKEGDKCRSPKMNEFKDCEGPGLCINKDEFQTTFENCHPGYHHVLD